MQIFNIYYKFPSSLTEAGGKIANIYQYLQSAMQAESAGHGRASKSIQGAQGVPSAKLVESVGMLDMCLDKVCSNVSDLHAETVRGCEGVDYLTQ